MTADGEEDSEDNAGWQQVTPTKTRKRKKIGSPHIHQRKKHNTASSESQQGSSNRFHTLSSDDEDDTEEKNQQQVPKPPPIFVPNIQNINKMINSIASVISSNDFSYKSLKNGQAKLMIKTVESYRKVVKHFEQTKIVYHTYQLKQERSFRVVIKGIHYSTPIEDIKADLLSRGHYVRNVINVKSKTTKEPLSMFFVDIDPDPTNKTIYNIHEINNAVVKIEAPLKSNELVQCHRCQMYGHTKSYCRRPYRCVKCGMDHPTAQCTKSKETPPRCVHCQQEHTASYRGCRVYQHLTQKRTQNVNPNQKTSFAHPKSEDYNTYQNVNQVPQSYNVPPLYSQVAAGNATGNFMDKLEKMLSKQLELTNTLVSMMSLLMQKLCK